MRQLLLVLLGLVTSQIFAQKTFEGKIVYDVESSAEQKKIEITIYFSPNAIRLDAVNTTSKQMEDEVIIIRFDSAKVFTLKPSQKSYRTVPLKKNDLRISLSLSSIAGYKVKPRMLESSGLSQLGGSTFGDPLLHVSDNLFYPVPEIYQGNPQLLMVYKNHIVLGMEMPLNQPRWTIAEDLGTMEKLSAIARLVTEQKSDTTFFAIPASYKRRGLYDDDDTYRNMTDSLAIVDSTIAHQDAIDKVPQKEPTRKKKSPAKKKISTKQSATLRKND